MFSTCKLEGQPSAPMTSLLPNSTQSWLRDSCTCHGSVFSTTVKCDSHTGTGDMNTAGNPILKMSLSSDDGQQHSLPGTARAGAGELN